MTVKVTHRDSIVNYAVGYNQPQNIGWGQGYVNSGSYTYPVYSNHEVVDEYVDADSFYIDPGTGNLYVSSLKKTLAIYPTGKWDKVQIIE